jgi:hypothetical protein
MKTKSLVAISLAVILGACSQNSRHKATTTDSSTSTEKSGAGTHSEAAIQAINVYFETSGSMRGFVPSDHSSPFKANYGSLLNELDNKFSVKPTIYYLRDRGKTEKYKEQLMDFAHSLDVSTFSSGNTKIEEQIKYILESTNDSTISFFVTEGIFSINNGASTSELDKLMYVVKHAVQKKIQEFRKNGREFSIKLYQNSAPFNGSYFNRFDRPIIINGTNRPYYTIVLGNSTLIDSVEQYEKYMFTTDNGFVQSARFSSNGSVILSKGNISSYYWTLLRGVDGKGSFRPIYNPDKSAIIGMQDIRASRGQVSDMVFSVLIDYSALHINEAYMLDTSNYVINSIDGYQIIDAQPFSLIEGELKPSDQKITSNLKNHEQSVVLTIKTSSNNYPRIDLKLKRSIPKRIKNLFGTAEHDDAPAMYSDKTFGLEYLVKAFHQGTSEMTDTPVPHFELSIQTSMQRGKGGHYILILLIVALIILFTLIIIKNKRR